MLPLLYVTLVTMVTAVFGCSPPEGGFVAPTPAKNVHFADHVVIGEVRSRLDVDPIYGNAFDSTYGAKVFVQCTYKGAPLTGMITIGGAGFIPGLCTAKELEVNNKYLMFLSAPSTNENGTFYEQSEMAAPYGIIQKYLNVCGLKMLYPEEDGFPLKRKVCEYEKQGKTCQSFDPLSGETMAKTLPAPVDNTSDTPRKEVVSVKIEDVVQTTTPENTGNGLTVSFGLLLMSFVSIVF